MLLLACAPLAPSKAALMLLTKALKVERWYADRFSPLKLAAVPPLPSAYSAALVVLVSQVLAMAAAPLTRPPWPDTELARLSTLELADTLRMPRLPLNTPLTSAWVLVSALAWATVAPTA